MKSLRRQNRISFFSNVTMIALIFVPRTIVRPIHGLMIIQQKSRIKQQLNRLFNAENPQIILDTTEKEENESGTLWVPPASLALQPEDAWPTLFDLELPEGRCIGLEVLESNEKDISAESILSDESHWLRSCLHPDETDYLLNQQHPAKAKTFILGRLAMRSLLKTNQPLLKDPYGRPNLPQGYLGSISHKHNVGVALLRSDDDLNEHNHQQHQKMGVGVDIEGTTTKHRSIAKKILTDRELGELGQLNNVSADEEILLRFSLKEALYKAVHPLICQFVSFREAEVHPHNDGTATLTWMIKSGVHEDFDRVTAHWRRLPGHFLTSGSVTMNRCKPK